MREDDVDIWGDGSTFKGNDIERFYRYGLLANPALRIYKPWLDADFVAELGGRAEMSQWLTEHDLPYRDSEEKAYSTDANIWGATHEAKTLEHLDVSMESVEPIMGVRFWDPAVAIDTEDVTVRFEGGRPVAINGTVYDDPGRPGARGQRHRRPSRPRDVRPDREPHHRGQVPGHLRGAGHGPAVDRLRAAASTPSTTRTPSPTTTTTAAGSGGLLYEGRWFDPQSLMMRESVQRWIASVVTGEVTIRLRRGDDYTVVATDGPAFSYRPERLSMERTESAAFGPDRPHRPAHHAQPRHRRHPSRSSSSTPSAAGCCQRRGPAVRRARARRRRPDRRERDGEPDDEAALDAAAMELGRTDSTTAPTDEHAVARAVRGGAGTRAAGLLREPVVRPAAGAPTTSRARGPTCGA